MKMRSWPGGPRPLLDWRAVRMRDYGSSGPRRSRGPIAATPSVAGTLSRFRSARWGSDNLKSRGMEDRARLIDGANVRAGGQSPAESRANQSTEEGRQCPLAAARGRDGRHRRRGRSWVSRAQGARARSRRDGWHSFPGCGDGSREVQKLEMSPFTVPCQTRAHIVASASGPGRRRQRDAARQDCQQQSEPETSQKLANRMSHSTPHAG